MKPVAFVFFGGFIDFKKSHGTIVEVVVRGNSKKLLAQGFDTRKVHDTRNWESIEAWASEVARLASRS